MMKFGFIFGVVGLVVGGTLLLLLREQMEESLSYAEDTGLPHIPRAKANKEKNHTL